MDDDLIQEVDRVKRALASLAYKGVRVRASIAYDVPGAVVIEEFDSEVNPCYSNML